MKASATYSGAVGTARQAATSARPVWLTAERAASAPGLIRSLPANKKVNKYIKVVDWKVKFQFGLNSQRSEADSDAQRLEMSPPALSAVTLTPTTAANITSAWAATPASTVARSAPSSRLVSMTSAVSALIPKKSMDGKLIKDYKSCTARYNLKNLTCAKNLNKKKSKKLFLHGWNLLTWRVDKSQQSMLHIKPKQ